MKMHSKKANSRAAQNSKKQAVATGGATICCLLANNLAPQKSHGCQRRVQISNPDI